MGRSAYQRQINTMKIYEINPFPSWKKLQEYQIAFTPDIEKIDPKDNLGIKISFKQGIHLTVVQILSTLENIPISQKLYFHF